MRYRNAIEDSLVIEDSELLPLVTLRPGAPMVRYDETGTKVLLLNVHCHPETFKPHTAGILLFNLWTFTDLEFLAWLETRGSKYHGTNWSQRFLRHARHTLQYSRFRLLGQAASCDSPRL